MPSVNVNGIDLYYETRGAGEPLVVIQGVAGDISMPSPYADPLAGKYQVIMFDNRCMGRSGKSDAPMTVEAMAEDTIGLMDALGIRRAHLLGISLGSRIAMTVAAKYPDRVSSLVLNVSAARVPYLRDLKVTFAMWMLRRVVKSGKLEKMLPSRYPPDRATLLRQLDVNNSFDSRGLLNKIKAPTLIVNGTKDISVPPKCSRELERGIRGAKLIMVPGDHIFIGTHPEWLTIPALEFLAEVDARAACPASKPVA